jgi:Ca2+-binding RTX toxin-like protein
VSRIVAFGFEGSDTIEVRRAVTLESQLHGGIGNDQLRAGKGGSLLLGGTGNDVLHGGAGHDILVGGLGADRVYGSDTLTQGTDSDLLIAGTTAFDANDAAMRAIVNEWQSGRSYAERTTRLASGADGLPLLGLTTVSDDLEANQLFGGTGLDWFFADLTRDSTDRAASERMN